MLVGINLTLIILMLNIECLIFNIESEYWI